MRQLRVAVVAVTLGAVACGLSVVGVGIDGAVVGDSGAPRPGTDGAVTPESDAARGDADVDSATPPVCPADTNFTSDVHNCGTCGHDCLGGACTSSVCQPFTLASELDGPYAIASDGALLYVSLYEGKKIVSCPISGCGASAKPLANTPEGPSTIAVANGLLYWWLYDTGDLYTCTLPACSDPHSIHTGGVDGANPGAVHDGALFVPSFHPSVRNVQRCALPACTTYTEIFKGDAPDGVAVTDTSIFITEFNLGTILRCPSSGCPITPEVFAGSQDGPTGIAVDGRRVYWANNVTGKGAIMACPLAGCGASGPVPLATNEARPLGVVVDDKRVVWTTWQSPGTVRAIAK